MPPKGRDATILGFGGHIQALGRLHLRTIRNRRTCLHALRMDRADLRAVRGRLQALPPPPGRVPDGRADRAKGLLAGAVVLEDIMTLGGHSMLTICTRGVVRGLLVRETFGEARFS